MRMGKVSELKVEDLKDILLGVIKEALEDIKEDIEALASDEYIESIKEARREYREGKYKRLEDIDV